MAAAYTPCRGSYRLSAGVPGQRGHCQRCRKRVTLRAFAALPGVFTPRHKAAVSLKKEKT
jgi:hypothetical protein